MAPVIAALDSGSGSRSGASRALRRCPIRRMVGQHSCLLEYGPCLIGMSAAGRVGFRGVVTEGRDGIFFGDGTDLARLAVATA